MLLYDLTVVIFDFLQLSELGSFVCQSNLHIIQVAPFLRQLVDFVQMARDHYFFELHEIKHLLQQKFPLCCILLRRQDHIEVKRHVLVDFSNALISKQVTVNEGDGSLNVIRYRQALVLKR